MPTGTTTDKEGNEIEIPLVEVEIIELRHLLLQGDNNEIIHKFMNDLEKWIAEYPELWDTPSIDWVK